MAGGPDSEAGGLCEAEHRQGEPQGEVADRRRAEAPEPATRATARLPIITAPMPSAVANRRAAIAETEGVADRHG